MLALASVVAVGATRQPAAPAATTPCMMLLAVVPIALYPRLPPPGATDQQVDDVGRLNATLALVRAQIEEACR